LEIQAGPMDQEGHFERGAQGAVLAVVLEAPLGARGEGLGVLSELSALSLPEEGLSREEGLVFRFPPQLRPTRFTLSGITQGPDQFGEGAFEAVHVFVNGHFLMDVAGQDGGTVTVPLPAGVSTLAITPLLVETPEIPLLSWDPVFFVASIEGTVAGEGSGGHAVVLDLRPGACPNPLNSASHGVFPAAIYGTATFNAARLDPASIRLAGVRPLRTGLEDVGAPGAPGAPCAAGPDRLPDLTLKFDTQALVRAVRALGPVKDGQVVTLPLEGRLRDGTPVASQDTVVLRLHRNIQK
jgi:hypothetical protein